MTDLTNTRSAPDLSAHRVATVPPTPPSSIPILRHAILVALALAAMVSAVSARQAPESKAEWTATEWIPWLERPARLTELNIDPIVAALALRRGNVVADIGAGAGVFEPALAEAVSPEGKIYANEIEQAFLDHIDARMRERHVQNVVTVLGGPEDPRLPARDVDVVLLHVVLHHVADRARFLAITATYLKPSGRIAVIEVPPGASDEDQRPFVSREQVDVWMKAAGLQPIRTIDFLLPGRWFVIYGKSGH